MKAVYKGVYITRTCYRESFPIALKRYLSEKANFVVLFSGGFRGGSRGSLEPPSGAKLFHFHGEFQEILCQTWQLNPPFYF